MNRYYCDLLVTMDGAIDDITASVSLPDPIPGGVVDVGDDGRIVWCGSSKDAPECSSADVYRIKGILMPGMINAHCHTPMVLLRGAGEGLPVDRWLKEVVWPREARLTPDDVNAGMRLGAAELLSNGITTSLEMYFFADALAEAAISVGLRCLIAPPVIEDDTLSEILGSYQDQLEAIVAVHERWQDNDLVDIALGPHAPYSVSRRCFSDIAEIASELNMIVSTHIAEQQWEDASIRERSAGLSALRYLESAGLMESKLIAAHCVWLSDDDIALMADNDVSVVHCPCSNARHASGIAPVHGMRSAGIPVAIGTDGPVSHNRLDIFEEMRTAIRLARVNSGDAQRFTTSEALWMTTAGAAEVIGRGADLGRIAPGYWADMVALSAPTEAWYPIVESEDDPIARLVWSGSPDVVSDVWVAGRKVVTKGRLNTLDVAAELPGFNERATRLAGE